MEQVIEVLIKKDVTLKDKLKVIISIIAICIFDVLCMKPQSILFVFLPIIVVASCFAIYYVVIYNSIEYEYILINDELDIDKIMGKSKRKKVITVKKNQIVDFDCVLSPNFSEYKKRSNEVIVVASNEKSDENYYIALNNNKKTLIILNKVENIYKILKKR